MTLKKNQEPLECYVPFGRRCVSPISLRSRNFQVPNQEHWAGNGSCNQQKNSLVGLNHTKIYFTLEWFVYGGLRFLKLILESLEFSVTGFNHMSVLLVSNVVISRRCVQDHISLSVGLRSFNIICFQSPFWRIPVRLSYAYFVYFRSSASKVPNLFIQ